MSEDGNGYRMAIPKKEPKQIFIWLVHPKITRPDRTLVYAPYDYYRASGVSHVAR